MGTTKIETTKKKVKKEAAEHKAETLEKKGAVAKAEAKETIDDIKLGALNLAEKVADKFDEVKAKVKKAI
ncbi:MULTISPECIES: hypothetical protein [unclassified Arcicella]|uniref:hypothetical protein n=1 Tax=unclassified Arcicella TaxID=2644986 RepID=UPI002856C4EB|nr:MULTISPECIES: hypothetical protein [unclassified Arcicella]MDR6562980.1 hypothetical protein [Arcicella sp. BE51]MDR6813064.1 hypothetical protein [Arcicella sp. BE140]MDR6824378.1 hypothetical protein [Arcicella sp. BE139]